MERIILNNKTGFLENTINLYKKSTIIQQKQWDSWDELERQYLIYKPNNGWTEGLMVWRLTTL